MLVEKSRSTSIQFLLRIMQYFRIPRRKSFAVFRLKSLSIVSYVSDIILAPLKIFTFFIVLTEKIMQMLLPHDIRTAKHLVLQNIKANR